MVPLSSRMVLESTKESRNIFRLMVLIREDKAHEKGSDSGPTTKVIHTFFAIILKTNLSLYVHSYISDTFLQNPFSQDMRLLYPIQSSRLPAS